MRRLAFALETHQDVFAFYAEERGWVEVAPEATDFDEHLIRTWQVPQGGMVRFVDDDAIDVQYIEISADSAESIEAAVQEEFTCYDKLDCLGLVDLRQREETVTHALRLLTCTASGGFDPAVFEVTSSALRDERENVRVAALRIPRYTEWGEFLPQVGETFSNDPSERVRGHAGNVKLILELTRSE